MDQEKVGKFIKEIRIKNNLTQKEFADKLGVTFQAVSKWENGKNIPDISLIKEISKMFDVNIDEILEGEKKEKKKNNLLYIIGGIVFLVIIIILITVLSNNSHNFEFKQISTSCDNFNITGSMAYNKDKTSLYISSIEFCGSDDSEVYKSIECRLYEKHESEETQISSCKSGSNITLEEYLKEVQISVDNYESSCKNFSNSKMYLEISATLDDNKNVTYKIPITLVDNCSTK